MKSFIKTSTFIYLFVIVILFTMAASCDDILEKNITDKTITIIAPTEGINIDSNTISFQWNTIDGADQYNVQVLNNTNTLVIDSLVNTNSLSHELIPGNYSWRVKGKNFAHETAYTFPISFTVQILGNLANHTIILNSPTDSIYRNTTTGIIVTWSPLEAASSYTFELDKNIAGAITTQNITAGITNTSHAIDSSNFAEDASYIWKIKAVNNTSSTLFSSRTILLDTTTPNPPNLTSPDHNHVTTTTELQFQWNTTPDIGTIQSPITNILEIATDSIFTNIIQTYTVSNNTQSHTFSEANNYFWRVKSKDAAGNISGHNGMRKLTIN